MKRKSITVYTVLISVIFVFCIGFFAYNIFYEYNHGNERVKKTNEFVVNSIKRDGYESDFSKLFENLDDYDSIYIEANGNVLFSFPNAEAKNAESTKFTKVFRTSIITFDGNFKTVLSLYVLRPSVIFYYAKFSFIAILVATIFSIILIIYFSLTTKNETPLDFSNDETNEDEENLNKSEENTNQEKSETNKNELLQSETENETEPILNNEQNETEQEQKNENQTNGINKNQKEPSESSQEIQDEPILPENQEETNVNESSDTYEVSPTPLKDSFENENEASENQEKPTKTGLSPENQILPRLETELIKAASDEQDLSLFIIKVEGLDFSSEYAKEISKYLLSEFLFKNIIFEFNDDSFAVIKRDMNIEKAEKTADKILGDITKILETSELKCYIGISSRSIRMLSAERLLKEANEALTHSIDDEESRITAFHVDVEKYREYLKNKENH